MKTQKKILIAHHGEIARRIQVSCHSKGFLCVAVYTDDEVGSSYLASAHQVFRLSGSGAQAYLDQDNIIAIAHQAGVHAIHPGYGFLSENASFAQRVVDEGFVWIGPDAKTIELMGDKIKARHIAQAHGIPTIPGSHFAADKQGYAAAASYAKEIGFPVIIKNPLTGGGKGIRKVSHQEYFFDAWQAVLVESRDQDFISHLLVEKCIVHGRHIEVQIIGDGSTYLHAYERECSLQRRNQKIIEEAPCLFISQGLKEALYVASCKLAQAVGYKGVGTVELLVVEELFYFLEMNTRLQVEHSVTEMITGIDLVDEQLEIAFYHSISYKQEDITIRGHAVEARVYAEDPFNNYQPSTGFITGLRIPHISFVRIDHDLFAGIEITPFFDPMIAKVSAYGKNRDSARARLMEALRCFLIAGINNNISFLMLLLQHKFFQQGAIYTTLLNDESFLIDIFDTQKRQEGCKPVVNGAAIVAAYYISSQNKASRLTNKKSQSKKRGSRLRWQDQQWV